MGLRLHLFLFLFGVASAIIFSSKVDAKKIESAPERVMKRSADVKDDRLLVDLPNVKVNEKIPEHQASDPVSSRRCGHGR